MKFQNVLQVLANAERDIANARASVENNETFQALYDAALEAHPIFIAKCNNTDDVRNLMREAVAYAISKLEFNHTDKILIDTKEHKDLIVADTVIRNNKIHFAAFNQANQEIIDVPVEKVVALTQHGTKFNISP